MTSGTDADARRALGLRPGAPPKLRVDEAALYVIPPSPTLTSRRGHASLAVPSSPKISKSTRSPTSPTSNRLFRRPTVAKPKRQGTSSRGLYETQKLLSHLLDKLEDRDGAPDLLDRAAVQAKDACGNARTKDRGKVGKLGQAVVAGLRQVSDPGSRNQYTGLEAVTSEDHEERSQLGAGDWDTDPTYDLVEQTRALFVLAERQGLDLFTSHPPEDVPNATTVAPASPKAARSASSTKPSSPTRSGFEHRKVDREATRTHMSGELLLIRCLDVLRTLISVDCLHRTRNFRPLCPPNGLQTACLDLASYLYEKCGVQRRVSVLELVVDGFYGMGEGMTERLCEWLEGRLADLIGSVAVGRDTSLGLQEDNSSYSESGARGDVPTFSFASEAAEGIHATSPGWMRYSPTSPISFTFPRQLDDNSVLVPTPASSGASLTAQRVASLIPRLLFGIASTVDLNSSKLTTIHRIHRLLSIILIKPDCSVDLLEIVAFGPPPARRTALEILNTFYPEAVGHNVIARRLASTTYASQRAKWESGQEKALGEDATEDHHFIPWRISSRDSVRDLVSACSVCESAVHGFCIRCTLCQDVRHLHCYQPTDDSFRYDVVMLSSRETAARPVVIKFSTISPRLEENVLEGTTPLGRSGSTKRKVGNHHLHLVNLFDLTLCEECHEPLWGIHGQAYACMSGCQRFFHPRCLEVMADRGEGVCKHGGDIVVDEISGEGNDPFSVSLMELSGSFQRNAVSLCLNNADLERLSYDETAVLYGALWTQYQIYKNGVSGGSLRLLDDGEVSESDPLGMRSVLKMYEDRLRHPKMVTSTAILDFAHICDMPEVLGQGYLFSDRYMAYCTALLKAPSTYEAEHGVHSPLEDLIVEGGSLESRTHVPKSSFATISLELVRRTLAIDLNLTDPQIVSIFIAQLQAGGHLTTPRRATSEANITDPVGLCFFTLPLLIDATPSVDLLPVSVDVLLDDLSLTLNESGLSLLTRRCWPSPLCSPYALERLGRSVIAWVMALDESLHQIVKTYASKHKRLPGVRATRAKGNSMVAVYKEDRQRLLKRYAEPWLRALHDQDPSLYAYIVYERCRSPLPSNTSGGNHLDESGSTLANVALNRMATVVDAGLAFTVLPDLITAWLEDLGVLSDKDITYKALPRLIRPLTDASFSSDRASTYSSDSLWTLARSISNESLDGLRRASRWMRVLANSGVEIPRESLTDVLELQFSNVNVDTTAKMDMTIAITTNLTPLDPERMKNLSCRMFEHLSQCFSHGLLLLDMDLQLLRQTMLLVLRTYGTSLTSLQHTVLAEPVYAHGQASVAKRKQTTVAPSQLALDKPIIAAILDLLVKRVCAPELVLDFLWLLFSRADLVANVDSFIHETCSMIYPCLWPLIGGDVDRMSRSRLLLRLLSIHAAPLEQLVKDQFHTGDRWVTFRTNMKERLLTFVLELADDSLLLESAAARRAAVGLVILFFEALLDSTDVSPDNLVILRSLLPEPLHAVSTCFEEYMQVSSDDRRLTLLARMDRLRRSLPSWPILSWRNIEELLAEQLATVVQLTPAKTAQGLSALVDSQQVRAHLLYTGLDMLARGITIGWATAQRFQQHVASACALPWDLPVQGLLDIVLSALREVLDSLHHIQVPDTSNHAAAVTDLGGGSNPHRAKKTVLIGAMFVPVVIDFAAALNIGVQDDHMRQRSILDILMVTFYKHDTKTVIISTVKSLIDIAKFVKGENCREDRLMAVQTLQVATERVNRDALIKASPLVFAQIADAMIKEAGPTEDAIITEQCRLLLLQILKLSGRSGLFVQLFLNDGRPGNDDFSLGVAINMLSASEAVQPNDVAKSNVTDLLFDDLPNAAKLKRQAMEQVINSLIRFSQPFASQISAGAAQNFGTFLNRLTRSIAEWNDVYNANDLLQASNRIINLIPAESSVTLLSQMSTLLHLCLARCEVNYETITALLNTSSRLSDPIHPTDTIRAVICESAETTLHSGTASAQTMLTILYFMARDDKYISAVEPAKVALGCCNILLRNPAQPWGSDADADTILGICETAALVLLKIENREQKMLAKCLYNLPTEAAPTQMTVFTYLLFAAINEENRQNSTQLLELFPIVARTIALALRGCAEMLNVQDTGGEGAQMLASVFTVLRLVLLVGNKRTSNGNTEAVTGDVAGLRGSIVEALWIRVWPELSRLVTISLGQNMANGPLRAVAHSIFFDLVIFLSTIRSPILLTHTGSLRDTLSLLVAWQDSQGSGGTSGKARKAEMAIENVGVVSRGHSQKGLIASIRADLLATERLRLLRVSTS